MREVRRIGRATLFCGDAAWFRGEFPPDAALVSDPPYGNRYDTRRDRSRRQSSLDWGLSAPRRVNREWAALHGNQQPFDPQPWLAFPEIILWGGNHYAGLPAATRWLVWDKRCGMTPDDQGCAELAWTNLRGVIRVHRQKWRGIVREGEENVANGPKLHPSQKPIALMRWCVGMTKAALVADPYMGSGTTGVAALEAGRDFVGCEIDPHYFEIACQRIAAAQAQQVEARA